MKTKQILLTVVVFTLILTMSACNMPSGGTVAGTPDIAGTVAAKVAIEQAAQTMVAQTMNAAAPAVPATPTSTNTLEAPVESPTPSLTPTITLTPTPEGVSLVVSQDTNCRLGAPYSVFKSVAVIKSGQQVEVIARNPENDSYYVKNPYDANSTCWIYGKFASVSGNTTNLNVATMQPTPTPTFTPTPNVGFSVSYVKLESCMGDFAFKFFVKNTSSTIWQYEQITGSDSVTGFVINHTSNVFKEWAGCVPGVIQGDLSAGEESYILNVDPGKLNYDPTGHLINITVKLCSQDGGLGTCVSKSLSFTP